jgi:DNA-binding MarR family transcriptional regulator/GNAT superfamily N-acetyltransferase
MHDAMVDSVRRFNRTVTQRVGALDDAYLSRDRPLGQARVLWEIGRAGVDVATLRARLDLDSGYLSRLLRALEADGLVETRPGEDDARERSAHLTDAGRAEWALLDARSDELARSILDPLSAGQRGRLTAAMAEVERLLVASMVDIEIRPPNDPAARFCMRSYFRELASRFDGGFDPDTALPTRDPELTLPAGLILVAIRHGEPVGCGALKLHEHKPAEIKRLWVASTVRGLGLGRRLLTELENEARSRRYGSVRLDTNRALTEAISMYRVAGYREVPAFNDEPYAHHWFEKQLLSS